MKIRAICVMKNESDIIGQSLQDALRWCDEIFVLDNGSDDGGWEKVQSMSRREPRIKLAGQDTRPFHDGIRARVFRAHRATAARGDWWCRLDADEFYVDDPRQVLMNTPEMYFSVWSASMSYYFTDVDAANYATNPDQYGDDVPIGQKCRYYLNHWSEPRFFRHLPYLRWRASHGGYPQSLWSRPASPERIQLKHFAYRSPDQIQKRLDARRGQTDPGQEFAHETILDWGQAVANIRERGSFQGTAGRSVSNSWRDRIVPAEALDFDTGEAALIVNELLMPPIPAPWTRRQQMRSWAQSTARQWTSRLVGHGL